MDWLIAIRWREAWRNLCESVKIFIEIEGEQRAASFAYYALFSLFPLFTLLLTLGSAIVDPADVISSVEKLFPMEESLHLLVWQMAESLQKARGSVSALSFVILIWSSIRFFQALVQGINRAWGHTEIAWWKLPLKNFLMMLVITSAMGIGLVAPAVLQAAMKILRFLEGLLNDQVPEVHFDIVELVFNGSRYFIAGGLMFYALSALYMLAPGRRTYFRQVWGAALTVALSLQIGQSIFGNYVTRIVNYNAIYGSVGALMLALMWVYISGVLILLGSCLCAAIDRARNQTIPSSSKD